MSSNRKSWLTTALGVAAGVAAYLAVTAFWDDLPFGGGSDRAAQLERTLSTAAGGELFIVLRQENPGMADALMTRLAAEYDRRGAWTDEAKAFAATAEAMAALRAEYAERALSAPNARLSGALKAFRAILTRLSGDPAVCEGFLLNGIEDQAAFDRLGVFDALTGSAVANVRVFAPAEGEASRPEPSTGAWRDLLAAAGLGPESWNAVQEGRATAQETCDAYGAFFDALIAAEGPQGEALRAWMVRGLLAT